jgi:hypothetical protein
MELLAKTNESKRHQIRSNIMKNRKKQILAGCFVLIAMAAVSLLQHAKGQESPPSPLDKATADALEKYVPSDFKARQKKLEELRDDRKRIIHALLLLINTFTDSQRKQFVEQFAEGRFGTAIQMLGVTRAKEATIPLMEIIDTRFVKIIHETRAPTDRIVIQTLIRIGKPASKAAVEYLARDKSSKRAPMYVRVIAQVEGVEVGTFMVQKAMEREKDPARKARLEKALELFPNADKPIP